MEVRAFIPLWGAWEAALAGANRDLPPDPLCARDPGPMLCNTHTHTQHSLCPTHIQHCPHSVVVYSVYNDQIKYIFNTPKPLMETYIDQLNGFFAETVFRHQYIDFQE